MKEETSAPYSKEEEKLNIATHAFGAILAIPATIVLTWEGPLKIIFGFSMLLLFLASTLYHSEKPGTPQRFRFKVLDHVAIFVLIAGTYTPFAGELDAANRNTLLLTVWSLAGAGILFKIFFTGKYRLVSTLFYVTMGWIAVLYVDEFIRILHKECLEWLVAGGIFYTMGAVVYMIKKIPYNHAVFHLFVLMGAAAHFIAIYFYL